MRHHGAFEPIILSAIRYWSSEAARLISAELVTDWNRRVTTFISTTQVPAFVPTRPARTGTVRCSSHVVRPPESQDDKLGLSDLLVSAGQVGVALAFCLMVHGLA